MSQTNVNVVAGVSTVRHNPNGPLIDWAAAEAAARGLLLHVVHAQDWPHGVHRIRRRTTPPFPPATRWPDRAGPGQSQGSRSSRTAPTAGRRPMADHRSQPATRRGTHPCPAHRQPSARPGKSPRRTRQGTAEFVADLPQIPHQHQPYDRHRQSCPHSGEATLKGSVIRSATTRDTTRLRRRVGQAKGVHGDPMPARGSAVASRVCHH